MRADAFFSCWTRKEAYLKALGSGLAKPLDAFEVTFAPGEAPALVVYGDAFETARWNLRGLSPAAGYAGALVTEGPAGARCWQWMPDDSDCGARAQRGLGGGDMNRQDQDDTTTYKVVVNHEEQYSIWAADRENPIGWRDAGKSGSKQECLDYIKGVWTDMRPLSLRKAMTQPAS